MEGNKWNEIVQAITDFDTAWDATEKKEYYKFLTLPEGDPKRVDLSNKIGFTVLGGTLDQKSKTASIEFIRPFDVSRDGALTLEGGQKYQLWIQWGIFTGEQDVNQEKVKGMRSYEQNIFEDHPGVVWEIQTPPPGPPIAGSAMQLSLNFMLFAAISALYFLCY